MDTSSSLISRILTPVFLIASLSIFPVIHASAPANAALDDSECDLFGEGTQPSPYLLGMVEDFFEVSDCDGSGVHFKMVQDIDLGSLGPQTSPLVQYFEGNLDGNGFRLQNLQIASLVENYVGLFSEVEDRASFSNLTLSGFNVSSTNPSARVGALFGQGGAVELSNIVVVRSNIESESSAGGIGGSISASETLTHLVLQSSRVAGDGTTGGLFGEMWAQNGNYTFSRWLVERSELERTSPPNNSMNYFGGFIGEFVASNGDGPVTVNLSELGFNGSMYVNRADAVTADDENPTLAAGVIGRVYRSDSSETAHDVSVNLSAFGFVGEVEDETAESDSEPFAGVVNELDGSDLSIDYSYISVIAKTDLSSSDRLEVLPFEGTIAQNLASYDVNTVFFDSTKNPEYVGAPFARTTDQLKDSTTFSAFNIQSSLDLVFNNAASSGGYFNPGTDATPSTNDGFLSFVWAKDYYGPNLFFNSDVANGNLLPDIQLFGLFPDNEYFLTVDLNGESEGEPVQIPLDVSSDDHTGLPVTLTGADREDYDGFDQVPVLWSDGQDYPVLVFQGTPEQIRAAVWRIAISAEHAALDSLIYRVNLRDALDPSDASFSIDYVKSLNVVACSLPSSVNLGSEAAGTEEDPYMVFSVLDFPVIGQCMGDNKHFKLANDVDFGGIRHTPIGHDAMPFSGIFDGDGHEITGLYLNEPQREDQGFFGEFGSRVNPPTATIKNLIIDGDVTGRLRSAILAGDTDDGRFENVTVTGTVNAKHTAGLLTGDAENLYVDGATLDGDVTVLDSEAGLLVGDVTNTYIEVDDVRATGRVIGEDASIGGLVGYLESDTEGSKISNVEMQTDVQIRAVTQFENSNDVGGLVGQSYNVEYEDIDIFAMERGDEPEGRVAALFREGPYGATYDSNNFGGAIGGSHGDTLRNVVSYLDVTIEDANSGDDETGGLIGETEGSLVYDCAAHGDVSGYYEVGGLIGEMDYSGGTKILDNSHAYGNVAGYERVGGLVGGAETDDSTPSDYMEITNSSASGRVIGVSGGYAKVAGLIGRLYSRNDGLVVSGNSYLGSDVSAPAFDEVGGLFGFVNLSGGNSLFEDNSSTGNVTGDDRTGGFAGEFEVRAPAEVTLIDNTTSGEIFGYRNLGGLIGIADIEGATVDIQTSSSSSEVRSDRGDDVGGFIGELNPYSGASVTISDSFATGDIYSPDWAAGFISYFDLDGDGTSVVITGSYATGDVEVLEGTGSYEYAGGFTSEIEVETGARLAISTSYSTGDVTALGQYAGGFVGEMDLTDGGEVDLHQVYAAGSVSGSASVGGLIGAVATSLDFPSELYVDQAAAMGDVLATASISLAGGFIGTGSGDITDSYARGDVSGQDYVGGFIGLAIQTAHENSYSRVFSGGLVTGTETYVGGFAGDIAADGYTTDAYFSLDAIAGGIDQGNTDFGVQATGLASSAIHSASSYENWEIRDGYNEAVDSVWVTCPGFESKAPSLRWIVDLIGVDSCTLQGQSASPYDGPIIEAILDPISLKPVTEVEPEQQVLLTGKNLSGITAVAIDSGDFEVAEITATSILATVPSSAIAGTHDLVLVSDKGQLRVQGAIRIVNGGINIDSAFAAWTSNKGEFVKVYAKNVVNAGKVQFFFNGKEIAWVRANSDSDQKLRNANGFSYFVRSVYLESGKNVFEIYLDGTRVKRVAYTIPEGSE